MWTPLYNTKEEGWELDEQPPIPPLPARELGPMPEGMDPIDYMILGKHFEAKSVGTIAKELGMAQGTIYARMRRESFKTGVQIVEQAIVEKIARGEFGVMAIFKAEAIGAARRILGIAKTSEDDRVRLKANMHIVEMAGVRPPTPMVTPSVERLIDTFTPEEASHFAATGEFPERYRDQLARLATSILEKHETERWRPRIEGPALVGEDMTQSPQHQEAVEVEEGVLIDE